MEAQMPNSALSVRNGALNQKLRVFDMNNVAAKNQGVVAHTPSTAAVISRYQNRLQN